MHKFNNKKRLINQLGPFEKSRILVVTILLPFVIGSKSQGGLTI
jgi:hypothetical protein